MKAQEGPFIADRLSAMLESVRVVPRVEWIRAPVDRFRFAFEPLPNSLIGALWLQCALELTAPKDYRYCQAPRCQNLIEISRDPRTGKRTDTRTCSTACRSRLYRYRDQAQRLQQAGWKFAQISKKLGLDRPQLRGLLSAAPRKRG